jgi:hypothetical protein
LEIVSNATWDASAGQWSRDNTLNPGSILASKFTIMHDRIVLQTRDGGGTWTDGGWNYSTTISTNSLGTVFTAPNGRIFLGSPSGVQTNPVASSFQTNVITAKNTCKAWARITTGGGGPTVLDGFNVGAAFYTGGGGGVRMDVNLQANIDGASEGIVLVNSANTLGSIEQWTGALTSAGAVVSISGVGVNFSGAGNIVAGTAGVIDPASTGRAIHFAVFGVQTN